VNEEAPLILVVDDNLLLQKASTRLLQQAGYRTLAANDGQSALTMAREHKPALTLLDVDMPGINGFEVCRQLKADTALTGCYVLLLSGTRIDEHSQVQGLDGGADGYLSRPVPNNELLARVRGLLRMQQAEQALRESEIRLREVLENSLDASYKRNLLTNRYDYFSPVFELLSGYTRAEMSAMPLETALALMHPDDLPEVNRAISAALAKPAGQQHQVEYRFKHKDGSYRWFRDRFIVMRDQANQPVALIGRYSDVTERKRTEAERVAMLEIMQGLVTAQDLPDFLKQVHTTVGKVIYTQNFFVILHNPETNLFEEIYSIDQYDPPAPPALLENSLSAHVFRTGQPLLLNQPDFAGLDTQGKASLIGSNSQSWLGVPLIASSKPIGVMAVQDYEQSNRYSDSDLQFFISAARHVGLAVERKQSEQALLKAYDLLEQRVIERTAQLRAANLDLERAARSKDEFLASMSHELRTPLTGILGLSEVLMLPGYGPLTEKQESSLIHINNSGKHLLSLINEILDLSKLNAGKIDLSLGLCDLQKICQSSLQIVVPQAEAKHLQSSLVLKPETIHIQADARRLKQIIINLLGNAVKFTPPDGSFGIEAETRPAEKQVAITVWDTGIGIQPEDIPRMFEPFVQLDARLARQYSGTGLGLALVKRLVDLHNGAISVQSQPGQGSRFTLLLPWEDTSFKNN